MILLHITNMLHFQNNAKTHVHVILVLKILHIHVCIQYTSFWLRIKMLLYNCCQIRTYNICTFYTCIFEHDTQRCQLSLNHLHFTQPQTHLIYTYHSLKLGCTHSHSILYIMIEIVISERYKLCNSMQVKLILDFVSHYMHKTENQFHEANALHSKHKNYSKMLLD